MAENVQYHLERMVGELEDLERRELFTKAELKSIVKKRTKFEYSLKRRRVPREAFLRYIEYEMNVDALRLKRKQRFHQQAYKGSYSDYSIGQRIISIYERAVLRHSDDIPLWMQFIAYIKSQKETHAADEETQGHARLLASLYARAITAHPHEPELWIMAAAHELDVNSSGTAARVLLQRALRLNSTSKRLWIEYFRLELVLIERIKARRRILGIDADPAVAATDADSQSDAEEESKDMIMLPTLDDENENDNDGATQTMEERLEKSLLAKHAAKTTTKLDEAKYKQMSTLENPYLQGAVARIVFEQAILAIPKDLAFREEFAAVYAQFSGTDDGRQRVFESIATDFAQDADARAYLCTAHLAAANPSSPEFVDALRVAVEKYARAIDDLDTPDMWLKYVGFLVQWCDAASSGDLEPLRPYFVALLERAFAAISERREERLNAELAAVLAQLLSQKGDHGALVSWLAQCTRQFPSSAELWCQRLSALITENSNGGSAESSGLGATTRIERLFESEALAAIPHSQKLWDLWFEWIERRYAQGDISADRVQARYLSAFIRTAALNSEHDSLKAHLQIRYVDWAWRLPAHVQLRAAADINTATMAIDEDVDSDDNASANAAVSAAGLNGTGAMQGNVHALRQAYRNVSRHAFPTMGFYQRCMELESDVKQKTMLHEMACRVSPGKQGPWLSYLEFLVKNHNLDAAASVFWSAAKALSTDAERAELDTAYQAILHGQSAAGEAEA
ncbi:U3 snoRNP protein [Coemansia sp. Benny D115]|nr:U3 snoRNP protein [Coemansia sp. Benny D115]